ncbi:glycoside hydrolase family 43 protein [Dothidotthia symphoricarpi CBS 119687]|uniref:Glycoside hydrolase family 43 protein n=1 Tax=Dothidotthia symphoricarpi CBS 119687 TaxID=1392245 RepID=A0A6A5ZZT2_9PLEO|nr:glycoside hydrolase family 43 protein [Dothidotthia symphoricarpi CBS 119687]KAF2124525.1 glycoside hydrolase family 43 protein [Dothidotthia symphoricarpi CBS 119687]
MSYIDTILSITSSSCPDPYVLLDKGTYYMTFTSGGHVELWSADSLFEFEKRCTKSVIWRPPPDTDCSSAVWAPELHAIHGRWYVYFSANHPQVGNSGHRMFVLEGPSSDENPLEPEKWKFHSKLAGMPDNQWAIDGTVVTLMGGMYFVYSGWPLGGSTKDESRQELYIAEMAGPTELRGQPVRISTPDMKFEFSGNSGINEGPQFLSSPDGRWSGIVYSCAGSWTSEYKMNILYHTGGNPLDPTSWAKSNHPLLQASRDETPPYGPGHGNFVLIDGAGGIEVWGVFHATDAKTGWEGRRARIMRVGWEGGGPFMGNGECGRCCESVVHFCHGCPGDGCGGQGHCGGAGCGAREFVSGNSTGEHGGGFGGGSRDNLKRDMKNFLNEGKGAFKNFLK